MNLTAEYMSIDSECQLFREVSNDLKNKIERSVYIRRKRKLFFAIEFIKNQHNYKKQAYIFRKKRKRIEMLFLQLCSQFMIRRNYAKSFQGFKTRILSKLTSLTVIQYI